MTLVAIVVLGLLAAIANLVAPVGWAELRQGREALRAVSVESAAPVGLLEAGRSNWVDSTLLGPGPFLVNTRSPTGGLTVVTRAELLNGSVWLLASEARDADQSGGLVARAERGVLVRVGVYPPDTVLSAKPISRPWVVGAE